MTGSRENIGGSVGRIGGSREKGKAEIEKGEKEDCVSHTACLCIVDREGIDRKGLKSKAHARTVVIESNVARWMNVQEATILIELKLW